MKVGTLNNQTNRAGRSIPAEKRCELKKAKYFETFCGNDFFRDELGNIYTNLGNEIAFCSNLKTGRLTEDKAEPSYPVNDIELIY